MHVLTKCTQIGKNVLSQHKFADAVRFCFESFQGVRGIYSYVTLSHHIPLNTFIISAFSSILKYV